MESDFLRLEQKNLSVAQYEAEFTRLAQFTPDLMTTERAKIFRFTEGLQPRLRQAVNAFELLTYSDVVNKTLVIERDMVVIQREREEQMKRRRPPFGQFLGPPKRKGPYPAPPGQKGKETRCPRCGKYHMGTRCRFSPGPCYTCGKFGHKMATCPLRQNQQPPPDQGRSQQQPRTQGRIFTLTQQDAAASNSVVTGILVNSGIH